MTWLAALKFYHTARKNRSAACAAIDHKRSGRAAETAVPVQPQNAAVPILGYEFSRFRVGRLPGVRKPGTDSLTRTYVTNSQAKGGEKAMIELFLSTDGKHTVHVSAETPEKLAELVPAAQALYQQVLAEYGAKGQPARNGQANGQAYGKRTETPAQVQEAVAPHCPAHQKPMVLRRGKWGPFWSCPTRKQQTGEWCNVTQEVYKSGNGQAYAA